MGRAGKGIFTRECLEGESLGLRNAEGGEDSEEHEEGVDLQDVVEPWVCIRLCCTANAKWSNGCLSNDRTDLSRSRRNTVRCASVSGRETFSRYDEGGCIGTLFVIN